MPIKDSCNCNITHAAAGDMIRYQIHANGSDERMI